MAESHTLFIIASDTLRAAYLKERSNEEILLAASTLVGLEEPIDPVPWGEDLQTAILNRVKEFVKREGLRVRVAGHVSTCFGGAAETEQRDRPMPDKAAALKEAVGGGLDIQVWGFHHEPAWSCIWDVLSTIKNVIGPAATGEQKREFEARLLKAFEQSGEEDAAAVQADSDWDRHEHLSVIAHNIMGQLNPLQLKLDTAADSAARAEKSNDPDYRARANEKAARLLSDVGNLRSDKREKALELLDKAADLASGGKNNECWKSAKAMLDGEWPTAGNETFRNWVVQVHDILKNLAR